MGWKCLQNFVYHKIEKKIMNLAWKVHYLPTFHHFSSDQTSLLAESSSLYNLNFQILQKGWWNKRPLFSSKVAGDLKKSSFHIWVYNGDSTCKLSRLFKAAGQLIQHIGQCFFWDFSMWPKWGSSVRRCEQKNGNHP